MVGLGATSHAPREVAAAYLRQSHAFVGVYGARDGPEDPATATSWIEQEYELAAGVPKLLYIKNATGDREPRLAALIERFMADAEASFAFYDDAEELGHRVRDDLVIMLSERFISTPDDEQQAPATLAPPPATVNTFVGREREVADLTRLLRDRSVRLVTLTGPGGIGKSRLALEAARLLEPDFPSGVHFVMLEQLEDPAEVLDTIARGLGLSTIGEGSPLGAIAAYAADRRPLVVLDNFEQVLPAATDVAALLEQAPTLTLLVTSRTPLQIRAEREYPVPSLQMPGGQPDDGARIDAYDAVRLFVERATAADHTFRLSDENAAAVAELTRRLDGLPLALEIAAARIRFLPVHSLLERLEDRFSVLRIGWGDYPDRHQTLWAAIEWSYELLEPDARRCFAEMGVFGGIWTLDAAEAVCTPGSADVLDVLTTLVNASLVQAVSAAGEPRFAMLQSMRDFALAQLATSGGEEAARRRHTEHHLALVERAAHGLRGGDQLPWLDRLDEVHADVMTALRSAGTNGMADRAVEAAGGLWLWWWLRSRTAEADALMAVLNDQALSDHARGVGLAVQACMRWWQARPQEAGEMLDTALPLLQGPEDRSWQSFCVGLRGLSEEMLGEQEPAMADLAEAVELARAAGDTLVEAIALNALGWSGNLLGASVPDQVYDDAVAAAHASEAPTIIAMTVTTRAHHHLLTSRVAGARHMMAQGVELLARHRVPTSTANGLDAVAAFAAREGAPELAAQLLGGAERIREVHAQPPMMTVLASRALVLAELQSVLEPDALDSQWMLGRGMSIEALTQAALAWLTDDSPSGPSRDAGAPGPAVAGQNGPGPTRDDEE
jgi:predicted ATPase